MGFDIVTLNYAVTLNLKIMTNTEQHETVSQSKAGKQLRIDFF